MARAIWSGAISFGLVTVPVKLHPATEQKDIQFHQFKEGTQQRIKYKRVAETSGREVDYAVKVCLFEQRCECGRVANVDFADGVARIFKVIANVVMLDRWIVEVVEVIDHHDPLDVGCE